MAKTMTSWKLALAAPLISGLLLVAGGCGESQSGRVEGEGQPPAASPPTAPPQSEPTSPPASGAPTDQPASPGAPTGSGN